MNAFLFTASIVHGLLLTNCDIRIGDVVEVIRSPEGKPERLRVELPFRPRVAQPFADMELCYGR